MQVGGVAHESNMTGQIRCAWSVLCCVVRASKRNAENNACRTCVALFYHSWRQRGEVAITIRSNGIESSHRIITHEWVNLLPFLGFVEHIQRWELVTNHSSLHCLNGTRFCNFRGEGPKKVRRRSCNKSHIHSFWSCWHAWDCRNFNSDLAGAPRSRLSPKYSVGG